MCWCLQASDRAVCVCRRRIELFDAAVVVIAFALYSKELLEPGIESGLGLIIVVRVWRVFDIYYSELFSAMSCSDA